MPDICTQIVNRQGQLVKKPAAVVDYNAFKLGVDKHDQLGSYYSFLHKSVKWWRKVFWLLEVATVNSYIVYKHAHQHTRPLTHLEFRRSVLSSLVEPLVAAPRPQRGRHPQQLLERLSVLPRHFCERGVKRRNCHVCSNHGAGKRVVTPYFCSTCSDRPYLCVGHCFNECHTKARYRQ